MVMLNGIVLGYHRSPQVIHKITFSFHSCFFSVVCRKVQAAQKNGTGQHFDFLVSLFYKNAVVA